MNIEYKESGYRYDQLMSEEQSLSLKQKIKDNSAVWHILRTLRGAYEAMVVQKIGHRSLDLSQVHWTRDAIQNDYGFMESRLNEYRNRLRVLADMTQGLGAKPIFVSQPSRKYRPTPDGIVGDSTIGFYDGHEFNGVDYYHMMRKLDGVTKAVASEKDALFVDLSSQPVWLDTDFYDFLHMTPSGAEKVGVLLSRALRNVILGAEQDTALDGDSAALHPHP